MVNLSFQFIVLCRYFADMCWSKMLLPSVVEKIFLETSTKQLSIKEILDLDIQIKLQVIVDAKTEDEFQNIVDTFPERFGFSVTKFAISLMEKSEFIQQITQHFCFSICLEEIQDFKREIKTVWN